MLQDLLKELLKNGKSFITFLLNSIPGITDYPGLLDALNAYLAAPTKQNALNIAFQLFWALAASHSLVKVLKGVLAKA